MSDQDDLKKARERQAASSQRGRDAISELGRNAVTLDGQEQDRDARREEADDARIEADDARLEADHERKTVDDERHAADRARRGEQPPSDSPESA